MPRILAIDADPKRKRILSELVREHVKAELAIVDSVKAAIASIAEHTPDLILAPALLSPPDEAELLAHMKQLESAPYVQMLTLPALDMLADSAALMQTKRDLLSPFFNRQPISIGLKYDRKMVAAQIVDGLDRARELRMEYAATLAYEEEMSRTVRGALVLARASDLDLLDGESAAAREDRRVALRRSSGDVPWLSGIKLSWGDELQLINISSTGVLVESGSKFAPGTTTELHLSGPETNLVVPARFIRSDVARIDGLGVRYHAAATFTKELDLAAPRRQQAMPATPQHELAALLGSVLGTGADANEPAHERFARGLRQLVGARDVQVRPGSASGAAGRETLYFDVPGDDRNRTTLQVTFDRHHDVTHAEFKLLKAAAWLTAAVLELEKPVDVPLDSTSSLALLSERVA